MESKSKEISVMISKIRVELTQMEILLKQVKKLTGYEKEVAVEKILKFFNQFRETLEKISDLAYAIEKQEETKKVAKITIKSTKIEPKDSQVTLTLKKKEDARTLIDRAQQLFAEALQTQDSQSGSKISEAQNLMDQALGMQMHQTENLLTGAKKAQALLEKTQETQETQELEDPSSAPENKINRLLEQAYKVQALLKIAEVESEMTIDNKGYICIVCKGKINATSYVCPKCNAIYCFKCINALFFQGEKCWSCQTDIRIE